MGGLLYLFFEFVRVGEMMAPSDKGFDLAVHLSIGDMAIDNPQEPSVVGIRVKQSKTDPFQKEIDLFLQKMVSLVCQEVVLLDYLQEQGIGSAPLIRYRHGCALNRPRFAAAVRSALKKAGVDQAKYCMHSFGLGQRPQPQQGELRTRL